MMHFSTPTHYYRAALHCLLVGILGMLSVSASSLVFADTTSLFASASSHYIERIEGHPPTGYIDQDFADFLLPQHYSGIELSQIEMEHGHNPVLRKIASGILTHSDRNQPVTPQVQDNTSSQERQKVIAALSQADSHAREIFQATPALDIDTEFARLMNAHHQRAIAYANEESAAGEDTHLIAMAHAILRNQMNEHEEMMPLTHYQ